MVFTINISLCFSNVHGAHFNLIIITYYDVCHFKQIQIGTIIIILFTE